MEEVKRQEEFRKNKNDFCTGTFVHIIIFIIYCALIFESNTQYDLKSLENYEPKCHDFIIGNLILYALSILMMWISYYAITTTNIKVLKCIENIRTLACLIWGFIGIDFCLNEQMI